MWLYYWLAVAFLIGLALGSFLNVCAVRLPYEKSLFWPGSRCGNCFQPIALRDNLPLISYFLLRGRCRACGARIHWRYPATELGTGLAFAALFYLSVYANLRALPLLEHVGDSGDG